MTKTISYISTDNFVRNFDEALELKLRTMTWPTVAYLSDDRYTVYIIIYKKTNMNSEISCENVTFYIKAAAVGYITYVATTSVI